MKLIIFSLSLFLSANLCLHAQNTVGSGNLTDGFKIMRGDTKGTPFLTEEWYVGYGIFENGETTRPQKMNYDIHGNNLVYQTAGSDNILKLLDAGFEGFILKGKDNDFLFSKIKGDRFDKPKRETKYYQIVKAPSRKVIVEFKKELDDPNATGWTSSTQNTKSAEYEMETNYYVLNPSNKYEEVKLKKNSVLKVFKNRKKELESYIQKNDLDLETPEELVDLVEYYYTL